MKKILFKFLNALSIWALLVVFFFSLFPVESRAQTEYVSGKDNVIATSDSRLFASIDETETTVTMKIMALGSMKMNMFAFPIFYDPAYLQLLDENNQVISLFGPQPTAGKLTQELTSGGWGANITHKQAGLSLGSSIISAHGVMNAILFDCGIADHQASDLSIPKGEVKTLLECTFQKVTPNRALQQSDFGLGISTSGIVNYQAKFGAEAHYIWYRYLLFAPNIESKDVVPDLFMFRSGQSVKTFYPDAITPSTANLKGYFAQGTLLHSNNVIDSTGTKLTGTGKLRRDAVGSFGFIYSIHNVTLSINEFSKTLVINGQNYDVPSGPEVLAGHFTRTDGDGNDYEFFISFMETNDDPKEDSTYYIPVTGLTPNQQYYVWAYTHYTYQTSNPFQAIGNRETFSTSECIPLNIVSLFTAKEPNCGSNNGEIYVAVTGGSGSYEFSTNGTNYYAYQGDTITGLTAGVYTIWVKDASQPCVGTSISNIILHNGDTDLSVALTASNSTSCNSDGTGDGTLYITVTGGVAPYTYFVNGIDRTSEVVSGMLDGLSAGEYVVTVKDANNCVASSNRVFINLENPTLTVVLGDKTNASCGESTGTIEFTVNGSNPFTYKLNGYGTEQVIPTGSSTTILLTGLSAGEHTLLVSDLCNEVVKTLEIVNDGNSFTFTYSTVNEFLSCDGSLLAGSITLAISGNVTNPEYSINGKDWLPLAAPYTIPDLYYGIYRVEVRDLANDCSYEINNIAILRDIYPKINIGTIFTAQEPTCGNEDGKIYVSATGGSGSYEFSTNGIDFAAYAGNIITDLGAGTYTIWVRDANNEECAVVSTGNIILYNGNSDMNLIVTAKDAETCISNDGILYVTLTGGKAPFKYYVNEIGGQELTLVNGNQLVGFSVGEYVVYVVDNTSCVVSSAVVKINGEASTLEVEEISIEDAICGFSTGSYTFKVTGSTKFYYQLNNSLKVEVEPANVGSETIIVLAGLPAGDHVLHVTDYCGEATFDFTIENEAGGLAFETEVQDEMLTCEGDLNAGSITIEIKSGAGSYQYSLNGTTWTAFAGTSHTITGLHQGIYKVQVKDQSGCTFEANNVVIKRQTSHGTLVNPPVATSPQTFCEGATVANLQATGLDITWYLTATDNIALPFDTELISEHIYYASQSIGFCESQVRAAVKVYIDNEVELEAPEIESPQSFCAYTDKPLTLADIATDGNTNIVWYSSAEGGMPLPLDTELTNGATYYAGLTAGGSCHSAARTAVLVTIGSTSPDTPDITTPQQFCEGAIIANIVVPNNQIVWYSDNVSNIPLPQGTLLEDDKTYFAAYKTGSCESDRVQVKIIISAPLAPLAASEQEICGKTTLADLVITGAGIVWFDEAGTVLPLTTPLVPGASYWAAQSSSETCVGEKIKITITNNCYVVYGTMFPFVSSGEASFLAQFPVTVTLFNAPAANDPNPLGIFQDLSQYVAQVTATWYDGSVYIAGTPKNPGQIGVAGNPGEPIDWSILNRTQGTPDNTPVVKGESVHEVGMFTFSGLTPGKYIMQISREGFLTRWAEINVTTHKQVLGHRELIAGDINEDLFVDFSDISHMQFILSTGDEYNPMYDFNGNGMMDETDFQIMQGNINAFIKAYTESKEWLESLGY